MLYKEDKPMTGINEFLLMVMPISGSSDRRKLM